MVISIRLDAGTFATMGLGVGYAIAACLVSKNASSRVGGPFPKGRVISVQGDSAFGFSAMELETASRYWRKMT